jgi:peroxiredoxin
MNLAAQLAAFHDGLMERLSAADRAAVRSAEAALATSGIEQRARQAGTAAPSFALPDRHGRLVRLEERLHAGPVAVVFVRGAWCPFCCLSLRAYQAALPALRRAGGDLLAITPQPPEACAKAMECHMLGFPLLSDAGNQVADAFGVTYEIAPALRDLYRRMGHDLPVVNRTGDWRSPLPASFVIGSDGIIAQAHVEPAVHRRMEPEAMMAAIRALAPRAPAARTA